MTEETPPSNPSPPAESEIQEERPSTEFAQALAAHEREQPPAAVAAPAKEFKTGAKVKATVLSIGDEHLVLDVGGRAEAVAETQRFKDAEGAIKVGVGDVLDLVVVKAGDPVELAPSVKAEPKAALAQVRQAHAAGAPITGRVTAQNSGGLAVDLGGVRGFCPMSQIELGFCADPSVYVGKTLDFMVTEVKDGRGGVVLSRRQLLRRSEAESGKKMIETLKPGDEVEGSVARLEAFGAFIDLGGIDGLVHVSEIRHDRIGHPKEALKQGEKVKVKVLRLETGKDGRPRIALSIKAAQPDPWIGIEARYARGAKVQGRVARLTDFGAFVNLEAGIDGLIHVSEAAPQRLGHVREVLTAGQEIEAQVLEVDPAKRRIALSIRALSGASSAPASPASVGDKHEGRIAGVKPFGIFVDLPDYGPRVAGMVPREETGLPRGVELEQSFTVGQPIKVEVMGLKDGRIRLRMQEPLGPVTSSAGPGAMGEAFSEESRAPRRERAAGRPERGGAGRGEPARGGRPERGGGGGGRGGRDRGSDRGGDRGGDRYDRGDSEGRGDRGGRGSRDRGEVRSFTTSNQPEGMTTMAIALRKAMERKRTKDEAGAES